MENPTFTPPKKSDQQNSSKGTLYLLQVTLMVAFIVATLFTAWTPASLLPGNLNEKLTTALSFISITPSSPAFTATPLPRTRIGIVAGHWGNDSGAVCPDGLTEAELNLSIATIVKEKLSALNYDVDLLKEFDPKLTGYQATALVSIHADSCEYINDLATGFKVAAALANPRPDRAARLTACMRDRYEKTTGLSYHAQSVTPDMTSYHAFDEISPETTAVIIEVGFMNLDRQVLTQNQDLLATGIVNGILCYIRNEDVFQQEQP